MSNYSPNKSRAFKAFTLIEILISVSIMAVVMTMLAELMMRTQDTVRQATQQASHFQEARRALETIQTTLAQARMDAVWSYLYSSAASNDIKGYQRVSDHHFILGSADELVPGSNQLGGGQAVFFQAPIGAAEDPQIQQMQHLLNCCGFYVEYGSDLDKRPVVLKSPRGQLLNPERHRFRLMQYLQPSEESILYSDGTRLGLNRLNSRDMALKWFQNDLATRSRPLASNILALILIPHVVEEDGSLMKDENYQYDSRQFQWESGISLRGELRRHQLPAMVTVVMVATDEESYEAMTEKMGEAAAASAVQRAFKGRFKLHRNFDVDVKAVESELSKLSLHHRTLSTTVALRGSKWISKYEP